MKTQKEKAEEVSREWFHSHMNGYQQCSEDISIFLNDIREMLVHGALSDMSCSSAIVEFDKLRSKKSF